MLWHDDPAASVQLRQLLRRERFRQALQALDGSLRGRLQPASALAWRAEALCGMAEFEQAAEAARESLALDGSNARALYVLGRVAAALDRPREAVPLYLRSVTAEPGFAEGHDALGQALYASGQIDAAAASLRAAHALEPDDWRFAVGAALTLPSAARYKTLRAAYSTGLGEMPRSIRLRAKYLGTYPGALVARLSGERQAVDPRVTYAALQQLMARTPILTYLLLAVNALVVVWMELHGGSQNTVVLNKYGAENPYAIIHQHEYWRLVTPIFLHVGVVHLLVNSMSLYFVGTFYERCVGRARFLFVYLIAGVGGSVLSLAALNALGAGASGAIFGIFGALGVYAYVNRAVLGQVSRRLVGSVLGLSLVNLLLPLADPQIDGWAHVGGLLTGVVAGLVMGPWLSRARSVNGNLLSERRPVGVVIVAAVAIGLALLALSFLVVWLNPAGA
jgi:membrane associated rhomboid family serine protease